LRFYLLIGLMVVLYAMPWLVNPAASLTPNAYDLAEWASLHPAVHAQTPTLLTSLLLRLPLACFALLAAFTTKRSWFAVLVILLITIALLPPPEFIKMLDSPNYSQQMLLAGLTLIGCAVGMGNALPSAQRRWIAAGIALVGAFVSVIGLVQAYDLMRGFELPTQIGLCGVALGLVFVMTSGVIVWQTKQGSGVLP
jgi:hypothetical protein